MPTPTGYGRQFDFTNYQTQNPSNPLPGDKVDLELNAIKQAITETQTCLDLIQRDDGRLENRSVGCDQLSGEALTKLGCLTNTVVDEYVYDIGAPTNTLTGADATGKELTYTPGAPIQLYINGEKTDPRNITATDGSSIIHSTNFPASAVVSVEIGEAENVGTAVMEPFDDISSLFDGAQTVFPLTVNTLPRSVADEEQTTISIQDVILQPGVAYQITGANITFQVPPQAGNVFWGINRKLKIIEQGGIGTTELADGSVTGPKIADDTITEDKLAFNISQIPIGGGVDWYDDVLPATAPAGSLAFPLGQTIGKPGSGATFEDDEYKTAFDIFKKRWGNVGTEDFDNLDIVLIPDLRGSFLVTPDAGVGNISANNTLGDKGGAETHNVSATVVGATTSSTSSPVGALASNQSGVPQHDHPVPTQGPGAGQIEVYGVASNTTTVNRPTLFNTAQNASVGFNVSIPSVSVNGGSVTQNNINHLNPYTVVEKIIRLK